MTRSVWKGPWFSLSLLNAIKADARRTGVRTTCRSSTIIPAMVGALLEVHNGHQWIPLTIREEMVGSKLGKFVATCKPFVYKPSNANKKAPSNK